MDKRIQDTFWLKEYAEDYIRKNSSFDHQLGRQA